MTESHILPVTTGHLPLQHGTLFWKYTPSSQPPTAQSKPHPRPPLIFIHAGVADHTLWDSQVHYFTQRGWNCLRYDLFGFGRSLPNETFVHMPPDERPLVDHLAHLKELFEHVPPNLQQPDDHKAATIREQKQTQHQEIQPDTDTENVKAIVIGLSMGAGVALAFTINHPTLVAGLVVAAGGIQGFEAPFHPAEEALFAQEEDLLGKNDVDALAKLSVRIWLDGPLQSAGRVTGELAEKMHTWNLDIAARECGKTGGGALGVAEPEPGKDPALKEEVLREIEVPVAVAWGKFDVGFVNAAMQRLMGGIRGLEGREFEAAHMINLEREEEFNGWVEEWLGRKFGG